MQHTYLDHSVTVQTREDGSIIFGSGLELDEVVSDTIVWLDRWAQEAPDRVFIAEREGDGWREVTYAQARELARNVAASLLGMGVDAGHPVAALSGPSVDHGILALATQMIGAPLVPLAEQYSLVREANSKLEYCIGKAEPVVVYVADAQKYGPAICLPYIENIKVIASNPADAPRKVTPFSDLLEGKNAVGQSELEAAYSKVGPDTLAKILFTSGSTSNPKGVPQTQRMMCVNQAQYLACLPILRERVHTMLDWLPWNHVFAGSSDFNMALSNGGSLYLDDGKPVGKLFQRSIENMRMKAGSLSFNVPLAHGMAVAAMKDDAELRKRYFEGLEVFFYAGASLPMEIWNAVEEMALAEKGEVPLMISSWGMTETAPAALLYYEKGAISGMIGVPVPGLEAKLIPVAENRYDLRVRGPNVIDSYFKDPEKTASSFDEEGFFITGDAVRWVDPADPSRGVFFDGRLTEDFKLVSGTWVQATNLRISALGALEGLAQDLIIVGEGHNEIGLFIFPNAERLSGEHEVVDGCCICPDMGQQLAARLHDMAARATGSSNRITRAVVLAEPPSVGDGEITAKGSLNVSTIVKRRAAQIDKLYDDGDPAVIRIK